MQELLFILDTKDKDQLGSIRTMPGLLVAEDEGDTWLRGVYDDGAIDINIRRLPARHTYYIHEDNLLFHPGTVTPVAVLKELDWIPIASYLTIQIPPAAMPGQLTELAVTRLVPTVAGQPGIALLTTLDQWKAYAEMAPATRLSVLTFAVSEKNEVLIMGTPLPPIPGQEYWGRDNMLFPSGYGLEIPMTASFIRKQLDPQQDSILLFDTGGSCQKINLAYMVPARRSAVRLTTANEQTTINHTGL